MVKSYRSILDKWIGISSLLTRGFLDTDQEESLRLEIEEVREDILRTLTRLGTNPSKDILVVLKVLNDKYYYLSKKYAKVCERDSVVTKTIGLTGEKSI